MNQFRVSFQGVQSRDVPMSRLFDLANGAGYDVIQTVDIRTTILVLDNDVTTRPPAAKALGLCTMSLDEFIGFASERIAWLNREAVSAGA